MKIKVWMGIALSSLILTGAMLVYGGPSNASGIAANSDPIDPWGIKVVAESDPPLPWGIVRVG